MIVRYPELQSGFVAYPSERLIKRPDEDVKSPVATLVYQKPMRTVQDFFFSPEVEMLANDVVNNPFKLSDLEFQAKVFQIAGVLFDKKGIFNWIRIQEEGRNISMLHRLFLEDTLRAVMFGSERVHHAVQWAPLISVANDPLIRPFKASSVTEAVGTRPPDDLSEFLAMWTDTLGMGDLILSLQVIFGRRTLHASQGAARY